MLEHLHEITSHIQNDNVNRSKMFTELSDLIDRFNGRKSDLYHLQHPFAGLHPYLHIRHLLSGEPRHRTAAERDCHPQSKRSYLYHILQLFFREYFILVTLGNVFALPVGYLVIKRWLETYANHTTLPAGLFLLVFLITCGIVLLSIFRQVKRAAATNPAEVIKTE